MIVQLEILAYYWQVEYRRKLHVLIAKDTQKNSAFTNIY